MCTQIIPVPAGLTESTASATVPNKLFLLGIPAPSRRRVAQQMAGIVCTLSRDAQVVQS